MHARTVPAPRTLLSLVTLTGAACILAACAHSPAVEQTPQQVAAQWIEAVRNSDRQTASSCLTAELQDEPMFTSEEGLAFWRRELYGREGSLESRGFRGRWRQSTGRIDGKPAVFLTPVLETSGFEEAIWLTEENGLWRIHTLFERPPAEIASG